MTCGEDGDADAEMPKSSSLMDPSVMPRGQKVSFSTAKIRDVSYEANVAVGPERREGMLVHLKKGKERQAGPGVSKWGSSAAGNAMVSEAGRPCATIGALVGLSNSRPASTAFVVVVVVSGSRYG